MCINVYSAEDKDIPVFRAGLICDMMIIYRRDEIQRRQLLPALGLGCASRRLGAALTKSAYSKGKRPRPLRDLGVIGGERRKRCPDGAFAEGKSDLNESSETSNAIAPREQCAD